MTADEEFHLWKQSYGYRAEKAGWTLWNNGRAWVLTLAAVTPFKGGKELWTYVLKFANTHPQCRSAVEFIARWNPTLFRRAIELVPQPNPPDWLQLLIVTAELRQ